MLNVNRLLSKAIARPILVEKCSFATFNRRKVLNDDASTAHKSRELVNIYEEDIKTYITTSSDLSDLKAFKSNLLLKYKSNIQLNENSFDSLFMRSCLAVRNLEKAKTYINILRHSGQKVNTATLSKYILLCVFCSDKISDKSEIETLCNELKSHSHYLNAPSLESIIMGLSVTENWKQGLQLLTNHEEAQTALTLNAYVSKLVLDDDLQSAIAWMECLMKKDRPFYDATYEHWVEKCTSSSEAWIKLTDFLVRHQVLIPRSIAEKLKEMLEKKTTGSFVGQFTDVEKRTGACRTCRRTMKNASITRDQFQALKDNMLEKVLCGADVYKGSHPEELHKFYKLIENNAPYDVVIDGLNVAYFAGHGNSRAANLKKIEGVLLIVTLLAACFLKAIFMVSD